MDALRLTGAEVVDLPLQSEDESGPFVFKSAEGLGSPEITVRMTRNAQGGANYQGRNGNLRQLIILIGLQPNWDIGERPGDLRETLYSLLTPKYNSMVRIEVMYEGVVQAYAQGQLSKMEASLFTSDPAVQITVDCDHTYLLSPEPVVQTPAQRTLGGIRAFDVENSGSAPSGFAMGVVLRANVGTTLTLADLDPQGQRIQIEGINWIAGDRLYVDTRPGFRGVWRGANGGTLLSVLSNLNGAVSEWMTLHKGTNTLTLNAAAFDFEDRYKFAHVPAFWGV